MSIKFSDRPYRTQDWSSLAELGGFLSRCDAGSVLLGEGAEGVERLYSVTLYLAEPDRERFGVGVVSSGETGVPQLLLKPGLALTMVGIDRHVYGVDLENAGVSFTLTCDALFSQFVEVADASVTLVFHGVGVIALAEDGWELWRRNVGRIIDWACENSTLFLRLADVPTVRVDVRTGATA